MSSTAASQKSAIDYISYSPSKSQRNTPFSTSSLPWVESSCSDNTISSPETSDSVLPSPKFPSEFSNTFGEKYDLDLTSEQSFNLDDLGTFDDWWSWDGVEGTDSSLTSKSFLDLDDIKSMSLDMSRRESQNKVGSTFDSTPSQSTVDATSPIFNDILMKDEPFFDRPSGLSPSTNFEPPQENLYSTPLSWSPPSTTTKQIVQQFNLRSSLTLEEQSKLIAQAMPFQSQNISNYPSSPSSVSSPEPCRKNSKKRKSGATAYGSDEDGFPQLPAGSRSRHPKKTSHNLIEKRYRTNLNDKIACLRDSVPSLRVAMKKREEGEEGEEGEEEEEDLQGLQSAHKLDKATILTKAKEYITHLEKRNRSLSKETTTLKSRIQAFETLMASIPTLGQQPEQQFLQSETILPRKTSRAYGLDSILH